MLGLVGQHWYIHSLLVYYLVILITKASLLIGYLIHGMSKYMYTHKMLNQNTHRTPQAWCYL